MRAEMNIMRSAIIASLMLLAGAAQAAGADRPADWDKTTEAARKEGKVVLAIPPSPELRKEMEAVLRQKFGLDAELVPASGPKNASRIAAEQKSGVHYFDAIICGTGTAQGQLDHCGTPSAQKSS
jgi:hypothetical protein